MTRKKHDCSQFQHEGICLKCLEGDKQKEYMRQYRLIHPSKKYQDEYNKKYYEQKKDNIILQTRQYYNNNKEKINSQKKEYHKNNEEYFKALQKKYWRDNKDTLGPKNKKYYEDNREGLIKKQHEYKKRKYHSNPLYRLGECLGASLRGNFQYSTHKKENILTYYTGCSNEFLKEYLTKLFLPGMTWENYGKEWHVDHIIPKVMFTLDDASQKKCWNYTNLRPLWAKDNLSKGSKTNYISQSEIVVLMDFMEDENEGKR